MGAPRGMAGEAVRGDVGTPVTAASTAILSPASLSQDTHPPVCRGAAVPQAACQPARATGDS